MHMESLTFRQASSEACRPFSNEYPIDGLLVYGRGWSGMLREAGVRRFRRAPCGDADTNLVRAAQEGAPEAFGELVRRYQDRIYTLIAGMVADPEDALDLTQETFVKAYTGLGGFRQEAGFYTWLYRIAVHRCIDYCRRRKRYQPPVALDQYLEHVPGAEPEDRSPSRNPERATMN